MQQGSSNVAANAAETGAGRPATLTDEQILGLEPVSDPTQSGRPSESVTADEESLLGLQPETKRDSSGNSGPRNDDAKIDAVAEPAWLRALEAQPEAAAEARRWRQASLDAAALDAGYFSAEPGARAAFAARLHADDPAAFRSMLADAARVLAERDPDGLAELARQLVAPNGGTAKSLLQVARAASSGTGTLAGAPWVADPAQPGVAVPPSLDAARNTSAFPAEAYHAFESAVNDDVARQVRDSIDRALAATLPDGIANGARRRIGEDIFRDLSAALSTDRELSAQIGQLLRAGAADGSAQAGWRFDAATSRQLAGMLAGRARTALPEVARRVVSEWTSSVLASDRMKQARIASAASRRDITGGRLPEPVASSALLPRRLDYARTSDEQILEM